MKLEIILLLLRGYTPKLISQKLGVSRQLVYWYRNKLKEADEFCLSLKKRGQIQVYDSVYQK
jgi:transposase